MAKNVVGFQPVQTETTKLSGGIASGTLVLTLDGELPVEFLSAGDRIITRSGARTLRSVHVAEHTNVAMIRISASALGIERPDEDMIVASDQPIIIRDWRAKALKGSDQAVIPAHKLADGNYIRPQTVGSLRLYTLEFDAPQIIYANGLELGCGDR